MDILIRKIRKSSLSLEDLPNALNMTDKEGDTLLHHAIRNKKHDTVRLLLNSHADPNISNRHGRFPIHEAVEDLEMLTLLIEHGADVNSFKHGTWSVLMTASKKGLLDQVKLLIAHGAEILRGNKYGWTCLHLASEEGHFEIIKYLVIQEPKVLYCVTKNGRLATHILALKGHEHALFHLLEIDSELVNEKDNSGSLVIHDACSSGSLNIVKRLVEELGMRLDIPDNFNRYPLHLAASSGNKDLVEYILSKDMTAIEKKDRIFGFTPSDYSRKNGIYEMNKLS